MLLWVLLSNVGVNCRALAHEFKALVIEFIVFLAFDVKSPVAPNEEVVRPTYRLLPCLMVN